MTDSVTTQGRSLTEALTRAPAPWRAGVQALAFHALRHWGEAMALTGLLAERPPKPQVAALLGVLQFVVVRAVYVKTMSGHVNLLCVRG